MQLDSQRLFFEERLNKMEEKANFQLEETELKLMDYMDENLKLKTNLQQVIKEKTSQDKKYTSVSHLENQATPKSTCDIIKIPFQIYFPLIVNDKIQQTSIRTQ